MKNILSFLLLFVGSLSVSAYPVSPWPLRYLVMKSEHIIIGYVVKTYETTIKGKTYKKSWAKIAIQERIQGSIQEDTIEVEFDPSITCPADAHYSENTYVLAFIGNYEGVYFTRGRSYGVKELPLEEIRIYTVRIRELQELLKEPNVELQNLNTVEWLVKCSENRVTRWEGLYELTPDGIFLSRFQKGEKENFSEFLTKAQKVRLKDALLAIENLTEDDFALVDYLFPDYRSELVNFCLANLKSSHQRILIWNMNLPPD